MSDEPAFPYEVVRAYREAAKDALEKEQVARDATEAARTARSAEHSLRAKYQTAMAEYADAMLSQTKEPSE